jgi:hypothetical protein
MCLLALVLAIGGAMLPLATAAGPRSSLASGQHLGAGCDEIGLALSTSTDPPTSDAAWSDAHAACLGDVLRVAGSCYGVVDGIGQIEFCALIVREGDGTTAVTCRDLSLDTERGRVEPDPQFTASLLGQAAQSFARSPHRLDVGLIPCTQPTPLSAGAVIFAAFDLLTSTEEPVVLRLDLPDGGFVALVADEPSINVEAPSD